MKCPHCFENFHESWHDRHLGKDVEAFWQVSWTQCPACKRFTIILGNADKAQQRNSQYDLILVDAEWRFVYPRGSSRPPCPAEVPTQIAEDYTEACLVLPDSPKASAALSRRCLQNLLRDAAKVKHADLYAEIEEAIKGLPSYLTDSLHAVRNIGNFAAHPMKSKSTGEIIAVEPGEAEWNLDVLEQLFDFYYVQPAIAAKKKAALNQKLKDGGKPEIK